MVLRSITTDIIIHNCVWVNGVKEKTIVESQY